MAAFTLFELLVVIGIIGILVVASVPAIRTLTHTNTIASGNRQMLDDFALARQLAIGGHRTVYMVFVPPMIGSHANDISGDNLLTADQKRQQLRQLTNLVVSQFTSYALFTKRTVGDQPGRGTWRYLTEWRQLPDGMLFATNKFVDLGNQWLETANTISDTNRPLPRALFPVPAANSPMFRLPYIAFDARGRGADYEEGVTPRRAGEAIALSRGSVFFPRDGRGSAVMSLPADIVDTPKGNRTDIRINWLTGRAHVEQVEMR